MGICNLITAILPAQFSLSLNDDGRTAHGRLMLVGGEHVCDVDGNNMGSRDSSSQIKKSNKREQKVLILQIRTIEKKTSVPVKGISSE